MPFPACRKRSKMATFLKHVQRVLQKPQCPNAFYSRRYVFSWYDKKEGVPRDFLVWLQQDYDLSFSGFKRKMKEARYENLKESQKFLPDRHQILGPDLATSHFIVKRGGAVKFVGRDTWFRLDDNKKYYLPNRKVEGMKLEAVDASDTSLMYIGLDNFIHLENLRYLNLSNCQYIDDWCLSRLSMFRHTLQFLDISGCDSITEDGLACLHHLENLQGLKVGNLQKVKHLQLMVLMLEEALPQCQVFGVDFTVTETHSQDEESDNQDSSYRLLARKHDQT